MGKVPVRLREVVYTLSPFQQTVMGGLWKDAPAKIARKFSEVREMKEGVTGAGGGRAVRYVSIRAPHAHLPGWPGCCRCGSEWGGGGRSGPSEGAKRHQLLSCNPKPGQARALIFFFHFSTELV